MKKIFLIGTALLLMVLPLAGCGVPQEDLDAAEADRDAALAQVSSLQSDISKAKSDLTTAKSDLASTESALADAESDLAAAESAKATAQSGKSTAESAKAAAESDLAAAESALADTEAQIADLEAEVAALEAPAEEEVVEEEVVEEEEEEVVEEEEEVVEEEEEEAPAVTEVETSFEADEYVNTDPAFSVKYPSGWTVEADMLEFGVFSRGAGSYQLPRIIISVIDAAEAATWEEALIIAHEDADQEIESSAAGTTADGTASMEAFVYYIGLGNPIDGWFSVVEKDDKWIVVAVVTLTMYFPQDADQAWEVVRTLLFQ